MIALFTDFGIEGPYTGQVQAVLQQAAPAVPVESIGPKLVKGRKESVEVYRVLAPEPEAAS